MPAPKTISEWSSTRAVALGRLPQLLDELREQRREVRVDLRVQRHLVGLVAVMRHVVVRLGDAERREGPLARLARHHEREDARQVGLVGHRQQVEHQRRVLLERLGHADRRRHRRSRSRRCAPRSAGCAARSRARCPGTRRGARDPAAPTPLLQLPRLVGDRVEDAAVLAHPRAGAASASPARPNIRSNATRGLISIGSGDVSPAQEIVFM